MAFILKDRVKENSTTTGTGNISLGGASATFDTFQSYLTNGDTTYYAIAHTSSGVDEWEVGLGTWNTGNTLSRTTVLAGSSGTSAVNFSAGTKDIFMTYPASKAAVVGEDVTFADITVTGTVDGRDVAADGSKLDGIETSADVTDAVTVAAAGALMRSGGTMTGNLILNADPNAALGAATKQYVDTIASAGIHYHAPVRAEHPSNLNATYNNGSSGVGATLTNAGTNAALVIDSVSMVLNDRVLVANQTDQTQNGVYTVTTVGDGSTAWVLTRSTDTDTAAPSDPDAFGKGDAFFIKEGATNAGHLDVLSTAGTIVFGTTNIVFSEVAETTVYSGGTGITLTGTTFAIGQDVATSASVTFNQVTAAIIGNVTGNLTGDVTGNADTATTLETARTIQLSGDVTGSASFDGSANINITAAVQDDSHAHVISNVDGLQSALDAKVPTSRIITAGNGLTGGGDLSANRTLTVGGGSGITVNANDIAIDSSYTGFDGRYYTESEADSRFWNASGDLTITGKHKITHNNTGTEPYIALTIENTGTSAGLALDCNTGSGRKYELQSNSTGNLIVYDRDAGAYRLTIHNNGAIYNGNSTNRMFADNYHPNADKWTTARTLSLTGDVTGSVSWDGSGNASLSTTVGNDSHNHDGRYYTESESDTRFLRGNASDVYAGRILEFGSAGNGQNTSGAFLSIEGNTDSSGEGSGRLFFREHNSTTASADLYGFSIGYRGGSTTVNTAMGNSWTGLSSIGNGEWGMWGHDASDTGALIAHGPRSGAYADFTGLKIAGSAVFHDGYHPNADTLTTARTINGVSFNGSANITVADSTKLPLSGGTMTGELQVNARLDVGTGTQNDAEIRIYKGDNNVSDHIQFYNGTTRVGEIGCEDTTWLRINQETAKNIYTPRYMRADGGFFVDGVAKGINGSGNFFGGTITGASDANVSNWNTAYTTANAALPKAGGTMTGDLTIPNKIIHSGDTDTYFQFHGANLARMVLAGAEVQEWGANYTLFSDSDQVRLGSGSDFRMWFDGTNTYFRNYAHSGGSIYFQGEDTEGTNHALLHMRTDNSSPYVQLYQNGGERLRTLSGGVGVTGLTVGDVDANPHNASGLQVSMSSNEKIVLSGSTSPYIRWQEGTVDKAYIQWSSGGYLDFRNQENGNFKFQSTVDGNASNLILLRNDTSTASGNDLGSINFGHTDGDPDYPTQTVAQLPARIVAEATETTGSGDDGARLRFFVKATNANKATDAVEALRLDQNRAATFYNDLYVPDQIIHSGDTNTYMQFHAADQWRVVVGGSERLEVKNSSPHVLVAGDLNSTSDERLKKNIKPIDNALTDICQLEGVTFDWRDTGTQGQGFIAQQVEPIIPDVVNTDEDTGMKSINYVGLIGHLVEAIKTQQTQIDDLKAEIQSMKSY